MKRRSDATILVFFVTWFRPDPYSVQMGAEVWPVEVVNRSFSLTGTDIIQKFLCGFDTKVNPAVQLGIGALWEHRIGCRRLRCRMRLGAL
jgi:hypothetical protein